MNWAGTIFTAVAIGVFAGLGFALVSFLEQIAKELKRLADLEEAAIKEEKERRQ